MKLISIFLSVQVRHDKSVDRRNHFICIGAIAGSLLGTIILRICLIYENRRRDGLSTEKYECESAIKEPCDWVSLDFIFSELFFSTFLFSSSIPKYDILCKIPTSFNIEVINIIYID